MLRQRKVPKRNAARRLARYRGFPVLLAITGVRLTRDLANARLRSNRRLTYPGFHCDARQRQRGWGGKPWSRCTHRVPQPVREQVRALFEASFMGPAGRPHKTPSCARPGLARNAGDRRQPMRAPGALLFGYFLLGRQEKVPRPAGRNPDSKIRQTTQSRRGRRSYTILGRSGIIKTCYANTRTDIQYPYATTTQRPTHPRPAAPTR